MIRSIIEGMSRQLVDRQLLIEFWYCNGVVLDLRYPDGRDG